MILLLLELIKYVLCSIRWFYSTVEMTSLGLNDHDLPGSGEYSAIIYCNLSNGKMPHIANKICTDIPHITHSRDEVFIKNAVKSTEVVYKYFSIEKDTRLNITARGTVTL